MESEIISGYTITHPHNPYEEFFSVTINQFHGGGDCWQAQIFKHLELIESDYFPDEKSALDWSLREMILIACVLGHGLTMPDPMLDI